MKVQENLQWHEYFNTRINHKQLTTQVSKEELTVYSMLILHFLEGKLKLISKLYKL